MRDALSARHPHPGETPRSGAGPTPLVHKTPRQARPEVPAERIKGNDILVYTK